MLLEQMHKKYEINQTEIKVGCQSGRKVVPHDSKSVLTVTDLDLETKINHGMF